MPAERDKRPPSKRDINDDTNDVPHDPESVDKRRESQSGPGAPGVGVTPGTSTPAKTKADPEED